MLDRRDDALTKCGPIVDLQDFFHAPFLCNRFDVTEFRRIRQIEIVRHQNHFFRLFHQL